MSNKNKKDFFEEPGHELADKVEDPFIKFLHKIIRVAVKVLAALMVAVIVWGIGDVIYIAIEIFINITLYLKTDIVPVRLVVATALMAISRKVIIFDFKEITPLFVLATAAVVFALGITYWLITKED